jgi:hypothetical protein
MTKRERIKLTEAIRLIHANEEDGGDYHKGMSILCELAGLRFPSGEVEDVRTMSIYEAMAPKETK